MYVYWWHVRGLRAVKVGHADEPRQRVSDYRHEYGLGGKDVRACRLDSGTDARWVESQLCRLLETRGFHRIAVRLGTEEEELFALGGRTFEEVHGLLRDAARHIALAEVSNRRKQQRRRELQAAEVPTPREQEQETDQGDEEPPPEQHPPSAAARFSGTARPWLYLVGAVVVWGLVAGGDDPAPDAASLAERKESPVTIAPQGIEASAAGSPRNSPCTLVELSDTLIQVNCTGSSASMRWNGRWVLDRGQDEGAALDFFNASDVARRVVTSPPREPVPRLPEQAEVKPERSLPSSQPVVPPAPPPQPRPPQAAPRPAVVQPPPPPQQRQEPPPSRQQCTVSRPKPGFQVYLVTCPNSQVTIGRTVDVTAGWTVSESVNGTEAIEFFMKSPYAR